MQATENKKIVAYYRVSTNRQMDKGYSIENQKRMVEQYADLYGYEIVGSFQEDKSGTSMAKRTELKKALALIDAGTAFGLITHKLDRLTRSVRDLHQLLDEYFTSKATLISVGEQLSTDTPAGRMILTILMSVSEWEAAKIKERVVSTHAHLKANSLRQGTIPYGKKLDGDTSALIDCKEEKAVIDTIVNLRLDGMRYKDIVVELSSAGVENRKGESFKYQSIRKLFIDNTFPAQQAQAKRKQEQNRKDALKPQRKPSPYDLNHEKREPWFKLKKEITYNIRIAKRRKEECLSLFEVFNGQPRATDYKKAVERYDRSRMKCEELLGMMEYHKSFSDLNSDGRTQARKYRMKYEEATSIDNATKASWERFIIHA